MSTSATVPPAIRFTATLDLHGRSATGFVVPPEVVERLGGGRRPAVRVAFGGHAYRTTVAARGDRFLVPVSAERRAASGAHAGDVLDVEIALDLEPRETAVPADLAAALADHPEAERFFAGLTASQQDAFVKPIEDAKAPETRRRRIDKAVATLREGRKR